MIRFLSIAGDVLFESNKETTKDALEEVVNKGVYLEGANLEGANLEGANLEGANLRGAYLEGANLEGANLEGANLRGANLRGANLRGAKNISDFYWHQCAKDMLYIFQHCASEVPALREKLIKGEIDGTQYEGDCCCLVGSLSKAKDEDVEEYCSHIPFYTKGLHRTFRTSA